MENTTRQLKILNKSDTNSLDRALITDFSRFYILLLLFEGEKHGYQIMSEIRKRLGQTASPSLVYPFLRVLEERRLVRSHRRSIGEKTRNMFSLTGYGTTLCTRLFKQFTTIVSSAIEPSMHVCAHCGCKVYKDAYFAEINGRERAFCCKYCAASYRKRTKEI